MNVDYVCTPPLPPPVIKGCPPDSTCLETHGKTLLPRSGVPEAFVLSKYALCTCDQNKNKPAGIHEMFSSSVAAVTTPVAGQLYVEIG